jgi:hypothetical protein
MVTAVQPAVVRSPAETAVAAPGVAVQPVVEPEVLPPAVPAPQAHLRVTVSARA